MHLKRSILAIVLLSSGILCILFGFMTLSIERDIEGFRGKTTVTGIVVDNDQDPLKGVEVRIAGNSNMSDSEGIFILEGVEQGWNIIEFYKDGYVGNRFGIIAYPEEDRWKDRRGDAAINDLSEPPVILQKERIVFIYDELGSDMITLEQDDEGKSNVSKILLEVDGYDPEDEVRIFFGSSDQSMNITVSVGGIRPNYTFSLIPEHGKYNLLISGKDILDLGINDIPSQPGRIMRINITLIKQPFVEYDMNDNVDSNAFLAIAYIGMGVISIIGSCLSLRTDRWTLILLMIISSFFGRGPFYIVGININHILSISALIVLIILRKDMDRRRS